MKFAGSVIVLFLIALYTHWYFARTKAMVASWAAANGYTILEAKRWYWSFPPIGMLLTTSREQTIMHVKVLDPSTKRIRNGYLRLGSYWWGVLDADAIQVRWQDE
jgi:hypothetical protein